MIMLVSSGLVGAMNLVYNLPSSHGLGSQFSVMPAPSIRVELLSSCTLPFSCCARNLLRKPITCRSMVGIYVFASSCWMFGIGISLLLVLASPILSAYLNLPTVITYSCWRQAPSSSYRWGCGGLMQGMYDFPHLAGNFVLEVIVS